MDLQMRAGRNSSRLWTKKLPEQSFEFKRKKLAMEKFHGYGISPFYFYMCIFLKISHKITNSKSSCGVKNVKNAEKAKIKKNT